MNCLVIGLGKSGFSSALALKERNNNVVVLDDKQNESIKEKANLLNKKDIKVVFHKKDLSDNYDLIVSSPGVPYYHPVLKDSKSRVISEIELAYSIIKPKSIIAVTGTNGKTTTVNIIEDIFKKAKRKNVVAGNIGNPYIDLRKKDLSDTDLILELSSFQLHCIESFKADIAVLLNVKEDHIDWHSEFNQYVKDKENIFKNQNEKDKAIINIDDKKTNEISNKIKAQLISVSAGNKADFYYYDEKLYHGDESFLNIKSFNLPGKHNIINALSATAAAYYSGIDLNICRRALKEFKGLPHRIEEVVNINNRSFVNDSKSTNPDSTIKALESMKKPVVLLLGGRNKDNSFSSLPKKNIKYLIYFGEAANELKKQVNFDNSQVTKTLKEAVNKALTISEENDVVLLSPGCSSFDEFDNYKDRGEKFKEYVMEITG